MPLDVEKLLNDLGTKTDEESTSVQRLLRFKFEKTDDGYRHIRCDEEIAAYHGKSEGASRAGKVSAAKRALNKASTTVERPLNERSTESSVSSTNQEPRTNNHKPNKVKNIAPDGELFVGIDSQVVADFKTLRVKQRAAITKTAINGITREALKAGLNLEDALRMCCERGWRSFKATWISEQKNQSNGPWWQTEASTLAKAEELQIKLLPGERLPDLKARIQSALDNDGKLPEQTSMSRITALPNIEKGKKPDGIATLKSLVKQVSA